MDSDDDEDTTLADRKKKQRIIKERRSVEENVAFTDCLEIDDNLIVTQYPTNSDILNSIVDNDHESDKGCETENLQQEKIPS